MSARLATTAQSWDEKDLLDHREDMVNGVNTETMQTAAQTLATAIVDNMHEVSELKKELWLAEAKDDAHTSHTVVATKQSESKGKATDGDKASEEEAEKQAANEDAKQKAKKHEKEVIKERQDWSKANPTDDAKLAELKKELWRAAANADAPKGDAPKGEAREIVIALSQSETKGKAADGDNVDKAKEEAAVSEATKEAKKKNEATLEAKKQAATKEHENEVIEGRQDWSKANPADDDKVVELKKELWRAEEDEGKAHDKVATVRERKREREREKVCERASTERERERE